MAAAVVAEPVSIPTKLGSREQVDLASSVLDLQKVENPQVSIHQCAQRYGAQAIRSLFTRLAERGDESRFEEVNLADNDIGDAGAAYLAEGLKGNASLKRLILPRAGLGAKGFQALGPLLASLPALEMLVLSSNLADEDGVRGAFSDGLAKNRSLRSLVLAACRLGDQGVLHILDAVAGHPTLEHLCLTYNRLQAASAPSLSKVLARSQSLRYLDLCGNSLGPEGAAELVKGLLANKGRLQRLGLAQNELRLQGARELVTHFQSPEGQSLVYLDLRHNLVTYRGMVELREQVKKPMDDAATDGWLLLFEGGERQLLLNAH